LPDKYGGIFDVDESQSTGAFNVSRSPWFSVLYGLADGDIYRSERIAEMPCGFVFRWLAESSRNKAKIEE